MICLLFEVEKEMEQDENSKPLLKYALLMYCFQWIYTILLFFVIAPVLTFHLPVVLIYLPLNFILFSLIFKVCKLKPRDLGLSSKVFLSSLLWILAIWIIYEGISGVVGVVGDRSPLFNINWNENNYILNLLENVAGEVFGNSLYEELFYRAFLYMAIKDYFDRKRILLPDRPILQKWVCILLTSLLFSLLHIPSRIYMGLSPGDMVLSLITLIGIGTWFQVVYNYTERLYLSIGVHAMSNIGLLIFSTINLGNIMILMPISLLSVYLFWRRNQKVQEEINHNT